MATDESLPEKVQALISDTAAWYAMRASLGLSVRDDLQAVARLAIEESTRELREENGALKKDAERLDFIEQLRATNENVILVFKWVDYSGKRHGEGLRSAIDSATGSAK